MSAQILKGLPIAKEIRTKLAEEIKGLTEKLQKPPVLAAVELGDNPSSAVYIGSQKKLSENLGIEYRHEKLDEKITQKKLIDYIKKLNDEAGVSAVILQLPVPKHIDYKEALCQLSPAKDAEGMHPYNLGRIVLDNPALVPCTPAAVMELLASTQTKLYGKEVVIVGHSEIVGKPLSLLLLNKFATVSVCHIGTSEAGKLEEHVKKAEILIVAVGKANLIKGNLVKKGAIVIDVGINKVGDQIIGDVEFAEAEKRASFITPVPGGVGPLTVTLLMKNVLTAYKISNRID